MLHRLRRHRNDEGGFTLIELLVVILIIGVLAAIAIPSFLSQKSKADDTAAKSQVRTGETAAETFSTNNKGEYTGMETKSLQEVEPTLNDKSSAEFKVEATEANGYTLSSKTVVTGNVFKIIRKPTGAIERTCTEKGKGSCPASGTW